jgi:hypothetical protein
MLWTIRQLLTQLSRKQGGQALVELALLLPILVVFLFGIIEFGRVFNAYLVVNHASREGVRAGVVGASDAEITQRVNDSTRILNQQNLTITISPDSFRRDRGAPLIVQVDYQVPIFAPVIGSVLQNPFPVSSRTVMRME